VSATQKEWNRRARAAGQKASAQARKRKAPTEQILSAYSRAYRKVWKNSPAGKESDKKWNRSPAKKKLLKKWRESPAGRKWRKNWRRSPKGRLSRQKWNNKWNNSPASRQAKKESTSRKHLMKALQMKGPLLNGWPDARRLEQKIGRDSVRVEQWRRAAQAYAKGIVFNLLFAATHEDAAYTEKYKIISFEEFAKQLGMAKEWDELVRKVTTIA
jgi:hypothetical protein